METVGQVVRKRREALGLTQAAVASAVGVAKSYLSMIENGRVEAPPSRGVLEGLEVALGIGSGQLTRAADWHSTPAPVRDEVRRLSRDAERGRELAAWLRASAAKRRHGGKDLDALYRSGQLGRRINAVLEEERDGGTKGPRDEGEGGPGVAGASELPGGAGLSGAAGLAGVPGLPGGGLWYRVPLINKVAAGEPVEHTDLDYPAVLGRQGPADGYLDVPGVDDPDAFATRIDGASMEPRYVEGDIVVCSPRAKIASGDDCFVRLEPDHESTFKRVYFEDADAAVGGDELTGGDGSVGRVRLQPLNPAFAARVVDRTTVSGMYRAVWKFSRL